MVVREPGRFLAANLVVGAIALVTASVAAADQGPPSPPLSEPRLDFLLGKPRGAIGLRGSWTFARAGSDLFDFVTRELTLDRDDFDAPGVAADLVVSLAPRLDVVGGFEFSRAATASEYRGFVDNDELPIAQTTTLKTVHLTGSVRYALTPRGRDVSRFAWVPRRAVPYVGAGAGAVFYQFTQSGDFIDFADLSVFRDFFRSQGWAPSVHVLAGVDVQVHRALFAGVETRYTRASAPLGSTFIDFDPIDLSGLRMSAGVSLLF